MKALQIKISGRELTSFVPVKRSYLLGRSPSCDVIIRSKSSKPVHFLLEWIGEGNFDPDKGLWAIMDISDSSAKKRDVGEAQLLSYATNKVSGFEFNWVTDKLVETPLEKGLLQRNLIGSSVQTVQTADSNAERIIELIDVQVSNERVVDVRHFSHHLNHKSLISQLPKLKFDWRVNEDVLILEDLGESKTFEVASLGKKIDETSTQDSASKAKRRWKLDTTNFIQVNTAEHHYYLRWVDRRGVKLSPFSWAKKMDVWIFFILLFLIGSLSLIELPKAPQEEIKPEYKRFARVEIKEKPTEDKPPLEEPKELPKEEAQPKPLPTPVVQKGNPGKPLAGDKILNPKASASAHVQKNEKPQSGLNIVTPITDVNRVGLLGKLKGSKKTGEKLSADKIMNQGIQSDAAAGDSGFKITQPPAGTLGKGKGGDDKDEKGLSAAASTLKGSIKADPKSAGSLGVNDGKGRFSGGIGLGGSEAIGGTNAQGLGDPAMEVLGGLDKDAVRKALAENKRAIRNCYESALLLRKNLEGRIVLKWRITPLGAVENLQVMKTSIELPSFETCVSNVVSKITFPKAPNGMGTQVIYPFVFQGRR